MVNYENGKIYKIINTENNQIVYIGSTVEQLCKRYAKHKHKAPNHKIILIQNYPCNSKEELCMKEQEFIEQNTNLLNKYKAFRSEEQKKEYEKEYKKEYNKDKIKEQNKEYREKNKDKIKEYQKEYNKEYYKAYYENNKEQEKERQKAYYREKKN